ncbi:MAG: TioE family transcriptional regulator [Pseudonocardia sp.]|uniref:TioE family transcriptional regulator n=1 Tax=unclassified Pseudonocardia TaxID=2619320 RepID=UPI00086DC02C|nr:MULTISPECIES: TioE family transcriptional regulator [unclassified Pseudonocardia]MBN9107616.1 TioE family transcriptional regulator [Pseudonocardia sp.]ODU24156.1 MAG: MerR family transcriptional regulator [Pseudonocardia sp. SCN 72-51]ODV08462.1 MAG: MerR family transcriptional regulator [Pseudonocardia sp. SCN 73-27]
MPENPQRRLRPVDLARAHGLSTQAVRNHEAAGILPPATRSPHGYRHYTPRHAQALAAFLALVPGHGHGPATAIMRAVNDGSVDTALRIVDDSHARLVDDRAVLRAVETALADLEPPTPSPSFGGEMYVGPLAHRLGIRPATLRRWERAGVVAPRRDPATGYRVYDAADVRDALMVGQLRRGGYRLEQIAPVVAHVRAAGGVEPLEPVLRDWRARLAARSRAMLRGAAALDAYLAGD